MMSLFSSTKIDKNFLEHIPGLRGMAILLIVVFHLCGSDFPSGHLGVEVFYVMSGFFFFLSYKNTENLEWMPFFIKKLKRILLPVAILVVVVMGVACVLFSYSEILLTAKTALAALSCVSNFYLLLTGDGYFAAISDINPLVHTWYVSVLLQLFLFCGLGCVLLRYVSRRVRNCLVVSCFVISCVWAHFGFFGHICRVCEFSVDFKPYIADYYNPVTRLWEFMAGGLVLFLPEMERRERCGVISLLGLFCILFPVFGGIRSGLLRSCILLPVIGTTLLVRYVPDTFVSKLFSCAPLAWIGKISFSLYLVHVPLLAFCRWGEIYSMSWRILLFVLCFVLAVAFYYMVERRRFACGGVLYWLLCAWALSLAGIFTNGFYDYIHQEANRIQMRRRTEFPVCSSQKLLKDYPTQQLPPWNGYLLLTDSGKEKETIQNPLLQIGNSQREPSFLLIGDSHAHALYSGLDECLRDTDVSGVFCSAVLTPFFNRYVYLSEEYQCTREKMDAFLRWIQNHPELRTIIIAQRWSLRFNYEHRNFLTWDKKPLPDGEVRQINMECLSDCCQTMTNMGKQVVLLTETPIIPIGGVVTYLRKNVIFGRDVNPSLITCDRETYDRENEKNAEMLREVESRGFCRVLYIEKELLKSGRMVTYTQGKILHRDDNHLSPDGAFMAAEGIKKELLELLKSSYSPSQRED